jgi:hypothetical protein
MGKIDRAPIDLVFKEKYCKGAILRFYMKCDDPNRPFRYKFGIVLNKQSSEAEALLAITTTNAARYSSGYFENDIVRISVGSYACFDEPTVVSLREIRTEPVEDLKNLYSNRQLSFEGNLDAADLTEVETKIQASVLIETRTKSRII